MSGDSVSKFYMETVYTFGDRQPYQSNHCDDVMRMERPPRGTLRFDHSDPRLGPSRHICHRYKTRLKQFWV